VARHIGGDCGEEKMALARDRPMARTRLLQAETLVAAGLTRRRRPGSEPALIVVASLSLRSADDSETLCAETGCHGFGAAPAKAAFAVSAARSDRG
jgi:hypothetical protein